MNDVHDLTPGAHLAAHPGGDVAQPADPPPPPGILVCDTTLRDGGYLNGHGWSGEQAVRIVRATAAAGVPFTEVGYFRPADRGRPPAGRCDRDYLGLLRDAGTVGMTVMAKPWESRPGDVAALAEHGVAWLRLPVPITGVAGAAGHVAAARAAGIACSVNLTRISEQPVTTLVETALRAEDLGADMLYLADSNGSLFPSRVTGLVGAIRARVALPLGFHGHDNLQLAFANSLAAVAAGCDRVDGTVCGIGKGGGNLREELFLAYLRTRGGRPTSPWPLLDAAPVLERERCALVEGTADALVSGLLDLNLDTVFAATDEDLRQALEHSTLTTVTGIGACHA